MLKALGRIHGADEARRAIEAALAAFDNVNIDLMYGLPGQSAGDGARRHRARRRAPARRTSRPTSSPSSRTPCSGASRRRCRSTTRAPTCRWRWRRSWRRRAIEHYETSAFAQARTALPPQPELLGVRRLPRHRRRRARQDQLPRPHHAPRARQAAARCTCKRIRGRKPRHPAGRAAVRVHAERAAPGRGLSGRAVHGAHRACRSPRCSTALERGEEQGLLERDLKAHPAHRARPALPQRAAGAFPARRNSSSRIG